MKRFYFILVACYMMVGCVPYYVAMSNELKLGAPKDEVLNTFGKPELTDNYYEDDSEVEAYTYINRYTSTVIYTKLYFKDGKLVKKTQEEKLKPATQKK